MPKTQTFQTQAYKGTRDFYPDSDQFVNPQKDTNFFLYQKYIFDTWRKTLLECGFVEYDCSIIEQAEIYLAKSGEELGGKQLYNFYDKSDRHIALRPEMTPSLARMVADKYSQLRFPLRWFSIPNCFRYEKPQKGRLREFWQLNVDIIGAKAGSVDLEILILIAKLFLEFGANKEMFKIMFNHRQIIDLWLQKYNLIGKKTLIYAVLDDWHKLSIETNSAKLKIELNEIEIQNIVNLCTKNGESWENYLEIANNFEEIKLILKVLPKVLPNVEFEFSPTIIRGIAYYTGLVFEGFNKNPISSRAMFGGGRYDNLIDLFKKPQTSCIGVGVGEVTWTDFLNEWKLLDGNENFETWKKRNVKEKVGIMVMADSSKNKIENKKDLNTNLETKNQINRILSKEEVEKLEEILTELKE
jgi:histidyl-tRNA synthetase